MTADKKLIELKNLGASSVNVLNAVGIHTLRELQAVGSVKAYRMIRQHGVQVSLAMLYALEGALLDIPWQTLNPALKAQLVKMAERINQEEADAELSAR